MSKHTEGPWRVGESGHNILTVKKHESPLGDMRSKMIAFAYTMNDVELTCKDHEELNANAHLIAAAPELLESLRQMLEIDSWEDEEIAPQWMVEKAQAAIAKATGANP